MLYLAHKDALEYESDDWQSTDVTDGELGHGDFVTQEFDEHSNQFGTRMHVVV